MGNLTTAVSMDRELADEELDNAISKRKYQKVITLSRLTLESSLDLCIVGGPTYARTFSAKQARLEVSKAKQSCQWLIRTHNRIQNTNSIHRDIVRDLDPPFQLHVATEVGET
ncbi:hypothetical protein AAG906_027664 [Vitis piasezkii]